MKTQSRGQLTRRLDTVFSQYIRLKDARGGDATCVTCGITKPWKEMQNGHFYSRGRFPTRWDEDNCHVQCARCNVFLKGNYINYTRYMIDRYGRGFVDALEIKSLSTFKLPTPLLREQITYYQMKVDAYMREQYTGIVGNVPIDNTPWGVL